MNRQAAIESLSEIILLVGPGYHPDTSMSEYVETETGVRTFSYQEALELEAKHQQVWHVLGDHIYAIASELCSWTR